MTKVILKSGTEFFLPPNYVMGTHSHFLHIYVEDLKGRNHENRGYVSYWINLNDVYMIEDNIQEPEPTFDIDKPIELTL